MKKWLLTTALLTACVSAAAQNSDSYRSWQDSVAKTYQESSKRHNIDDDTASIVCFDPHTEPGPKCQLLSWLVHSAQRHSWQFSPRGTHFSAYGGNNYLRSEVHLVACNSPIYVLRPYYFSKTRAIHLNKAAINVDGVPVFERSIAEKNVLLNAQSYGVEEFSALVLSDKEIKALRELVAGNGKPSLHLSGRSGVAAVKPEYAKGFKQDVKNALAIYDALTEAAGEAPACGS